MEKESYVKNIVIYNNIIDNVVNKSIDAFTEMVEAHDGFIDLQDKGKPAIFAYVNNALDSLGEKRMIALRLNEEGCLECYITDKNDATIYKKEDIIENDEGWYNLEGFDEFISVSATIIDMLAIISEYYL